MYNVKNLMNDERRFRDKNSGRDIIVAPGESVDVVKAPDVPEEVFEVKTIGIPKMGEIKTIGTLKMKEIKTKLIKEEDK